MKNLQGLKKNFDVNRLVRTGLVAAIYVVLTVFVSPLSYGDVQFRFAEVLVLLCWLSPDYCFALSLGCAIANLFSPFALFDVPIGTLATILAVIPMWKIKNIWIASLFPAVTNGLIVGLELSLIYGLPYPLTALSVAAGEFVVVTVVGAPLVRFLLTRQPKFMKLLGARKFLRDDCKDCDDCDKKTANGI